MFFPTKKKTMTTTVLRGMIAELSKLGYYNEEFCQHILKWTSLTELQPATKCFDKYYETALPEINCVAIHGYLQRFKDIIFDDAKYDNDDPFICACAAMSGYLDCLEYAYDNGYLMDEWTCRNAAARGHLDCLVYAHDNGCPLDKRVCENAAGRGHLDCLMYAHDNGFPWNERTCINAAYCGHLGCLQYAHENDCPWDEETCSEAAKYGHLNCLEYARDNGCPE